MPLDGASGPHYGQARKLPLRIFSKSSSIKILSRILHFFISNFSIFGEILFTKYHPHKSCSKNFLIIPIELVMKLIGQPEKIVKSMRRKIQPRVYFGVQYCSVQRDTIHCTQYCRLNKMQLLGLCFIFFL